MSRLSRRGFLGVAGGVAVAAGLAGCGTDLRSGQTGELLRSAAPLPAPFRAPLPIPPVSRPVEGILEITQRVAEVDAARYRLRHSSLRIAPAERFDVVVDFSITSNTRTWP